MDHDTDTDHSESTTADPHASGRWEATVGGIDVRFGCGVLGQLGDQAKSLGAARALVVTDPGLVAAGHVATATAALAAAGIETAVFDGAQENPTTDDVEAATEAARSHRADLLVGLGGGSSMDCAKGANFLLAGGGRMEDYWGYGKAKGRLLPSIGVPTTAGTGSEAQSFALVSRAEDHVKMACGDPQARFRTVLLDPCLLASLPRSVAAVAALDAVSHAVESFVTSKRNPVSTLLAFDAWRRLDRAFEDFLADRGDTAACADMLLGAHFGGGAIEASMLGAAHACANPLTARFGTTHGIAVGIMLPHVVRYNAQVDGVATQYATLIGGTTVGATTMGATMTSAGPLTATESASEVLARRLTALGRVAGLPDTLGELGVHDADVDALSAAAAEQWTGTFNPRPIDADAASNLYRAALDGHASGQVSLAVPAVAREAV